MAQVALVVAAWALSGVAARADEATVATGAAIAAHGTVTGRAACSSCHGQDGAGQPDVGIPRLAGLSAYYIHEQLGYFASGARHNYVMSSYTAALTPAERRAEGRVVDRDDAAVAAALVVADDHLLVAHLGDRVEEVHVRRWGVGKPGRLARPR